MARHGENIRKRKDGRWEGRYLTYSEKKEKQIYHSVYGKTYKEVKEKLIAQKDLLKNPIRQVITYKNRNFKKTINLYKISYNLSHLYRNCLL